MTLPVLFKRRRSLFEATQASRSHDFVRMTCLERQWRRWRGTLDYSETTCQKMQKCKSAFRWSMWNNNQNGKETKIQNSKNARSALAACYFHVRHNILGDPGKHKCMINPDIEWYVHVKMVIILPRKMLIRKLQRQKLKFSLRNHTFVHLRTSGENWVAFFQVHLTVIRFSAP